MRSEIETLKTWITESDNIVFFGGAGVSTESGIPDFRSTDGLYHQKFDYPPDTEILLKICLVRHGQISKIRPSPAPATETALRSARGFPALCASRGRSPR